MAKRGRKPKGTIVVVQAPEYYFDTNEEEAVIAYNLSDSAKEKNEIFRSVLEPAFVKMIEAIAKKYHLIPAGDDTKELFDDALAFVIDKMAGFKNEKGKAYSYVGTICKRYLICRLKEDQKLLLRNISYDDVASELVEDDRFSYSISDNLHSDMVELISETSSSIYEIITNENDLKLTKNEIMVGRALIEILGNWDELFANLGSNKFNKSSILLYLKEATSLSTPEIRSSMRRFKTTYSKTKKSILC